MIKIIDLDNLFTETYRKKIEDVISSNKESEAEDKIAKLYGEFCDQKIKELDGKSPKDYYKSFSGKELVDALRMHVEKCIAVPEFLCNAITEKKCEDELLELVDENADEELLSYVINLLSELKSVKPFDKYLEFITGKSVGADIIDTVTEAMCENAEVVKDKVLRLTENADDEEMLYYLEILSRCKHDDKILTILLEQFRLHLDNVLLYTAYLSRYGDSKALSTLYEAIEISSLDYYEFHELKFAIEALGGEYTKKRDFKNIPS